MFLLVESVLSAEKDSYGFYICTILECELHAKSTVLMWADPPIFFPQTVQFLLATVLMGLSGWLEGTTHWRVEWRSALTMPGVLSVMMVSALKMLKWCALSWEISSTV